MSDIDTIDTIDDLPAAQQPQLALVTMMKVCRRASQRAYAEEPEAALAMFRRCVHGLLPHDPATVTLDGWTRLGTHAGALAGWSNLLFSPPRDAPTTDHATLYGAAWVFANNVVRGVRHGG